MVYITNRKDTLLISTVDITWYYYWKLLKGLNYSYGPTSHVFVGQLYPL